MEQMKRQILQFPFTIIDVHSSMTYKNPVIFYLLFYLYLFKA